MTLAALLVLGLPPGNLVRNPLFAEGVFGPNQWALNTTARNRAEWVTAARRPDAYGIRLIGSGTDWAGASSHAVGVSPGSDLTVAVWLRSSGADPTTDNVYVRFWGKAGFLGQKGPSVPASAPNWTLVCATVQAPSEALTADVSVQVRSRGTVVLGAAGLFQGDQTQEAARMLPRPVLADVVAVRTPRGLPADANRNGLPDVLERLLAVPSGARSARLTRRNTTSLQTPTGYIAENDLKVDTVLVVNESREALASWRAMGYRTPFMAGFRAGQEYLDAHPGSAQMDRSGRPLDCGPGSYYMVPTADRRKVMRELFRTSAANGAEGAAPEEPEFFGRGAYSPAFQREFEAHYGRPWVDPAQSPQARVDAQRLMGRLEIELLRACYEGAEEGNPGSERWMLVHSPVNYTAWHVAFPFHEAIEELKPRHLIAQVWTGTAQSPVAHRGVRKARIFENAWLEYSSSLNLTRGKGIQTWLLMDPLEDAPGRPMEEYFDSYRRTLGAALCFPETDLYEVMPWPTRIFGQVPDDFATVVTTIVNALGDMQNQKQVRHDRGPDGIGTFLSDSAMWQRDPPNESDFDHFYGLCLPMVMKGVPVQVAYLDRVAEPGYLSPYKVLLVSFDAMKPQRKEHLDALAAWVRAGGRMVLCGTGDAYDGLDMWWKREGFASPRAYLMHALGLGSAREQVVDRVGPLASYTVAAETAYKGRDLGNRSIVSLDLTDAISRSGAAYLRFTDTIPGDGWGPWIASLELDGTREGKRFSQKIVAGSPEETAVTVSDTGSGLAGGARFVDGSRELVYRLRFDPATEARVLLDIGNQYRVEVAPAPASEPTGMKRATGSALGAAIDIRACDGVGRYTTFQVPAAEPAVECADGVVIGEARVGTGSVIVCGLPASWFTRTEGADGLVRAIVAHACKSAGIEYREQSHVRIDRGAYTVIRSLDAPAPVAESMIDLMTPDLKVRPAGPTGTDEVLVLKRLPAHTGAAPTLAAASDCVEWSVRSGSTLRLVVSNATGIKGALRVVTGGRPIEVAAWDAFGKVRHVRVEAQGPTALLRYDSEPRGLGMKITAK